MQSRYLIHVSLSLALVAMVPASAHAQFGSIGDRLKKKAKEAVLGKDEKKDESSSATSSSSGRTSSRIEITSNVLDRFLKGLAAEQSKREALVKRASCVKQAQSTPEYMNVMASEAPAIEKITDSNMSDEKKMAEMQRIGAVLEKKEAAFMEQKCGAEVERMNQSEYEAIGAEAGGFTAGQYAILKERIHPFCESAAKGGSGGVNLVFTEAEVAAITPRCSALLPAIKKSL